MSMTLRAPVTGRPLLRPDPAGGGLPAAGRDAADRPDRPRLRRRRLGRRDGRRHPRRGAGPAAGRRRPRPRPDGHRLRPRPHPAADRPRGRRLRPHRGRATASRRPAAWRPARPARPATPSPSPSLLERFRRVVDGEAVTPLGDRLRSQRELDDHRRADRRRLAPFESLTPRERDVLALIVDGRPAAEIARRAAVALPTVRTQVRSILQKLEVNSQMAAAAMARNAGWLHPDRPAATGAAFGGR